MSNVTMKPFADEIRDIDENLKRLYDEKIRLERRKQVLVQLGTETHEEAVSRLISRTVPVPVFDVWYYVEDNKLYYFPTEALAKKHAGDRGNAICWQSYTERGLLRLKTNVGCQFITDVPQ
jgi:hypothetical protein